MSIAPTEIPHFDYSTFTIPDEVNFSVYLAPHQTAADLPRELGYVLKKANVLVMETLGAIRDLEESVLTGVGAGDRSAIQVANGWAQQSDNPSWKKAFYAATRGSGVKVCLPDLPARHGLIKELDQNGVLLTRAITIRNYDRMLSTTASQLPLRSFLYEERDQYILEHLATDLQAKISSSTKLRQKAEDGNRIEVAMFYGGHHEPMVDAISARLAMQDIRSGQEPAVIKNTDLLVETIDGEIYKAFMLGQETITELNVARFSLERLLTLLVQMKGEHNNPKLPTKLKAETIRRKIDGRSADEIETLHNKALHELAFLVR